MAWALMNKCKIYTTYSSNLKVDEKVCREAESLIGWRAWILTGIQPPPKLSLRFFSSFSHGVFRLWE